MSDPNSIIPSVPVIILHCLANRWTQLVERLRDEEEYSLIHGEPFTAKSVDLAASSMEMCIAELRAIAERAVGDKILPSLS